MTHHINLNEKSPERLEQEIKWLIDEKYSGLHVPEAEHDIERLRKGEPVDYVIGWTDFCGCKIDLSLKPPIPRPGTERWVKEAIQEIKSRGKSAIHCLDIFAGSGCIGIAVLKHIPESKMDFAEIDPDFIRQIEINLRLNDISPERYRIIRSDVFENVDCGSYDYIFANPPYIPEEEKGRVKKMSIKFEPHHSFFAGSDGMAYIKPFLRSAKNHILPGGKIWMEYGGWRKDSVKELLREEGYRNFTFTHDDILVTIETGGGPPRQDPFFEFFESDRTVLNPLALEWTPPDFKEYPRSEKFILPKPPLFTEVRLVDALRLRQTERDFSAVPLSPEVLSALLFWSVGLIHRGARDEKESFRRPYPSGGSKYPVEIYVAAYRVTDLPVGVYHYNFRDHALELIKSVSPQAIRDAHYYDFAKKAPLLILLSFLGERTIEKYGTFGYKLGLLEGGHIGQNVYLVGTALGLGVCALGGLRNYEIVQQELGLNAEETVFYQLAVGWPTKR